MVRSHLYVPANNLDRLVKAIDRGADSLIIDLEDGVSPTNKDLARENLRQFLDECGTTVPIWVRVNSERAWLEQDLEAAVTQKCSGIVLPKTNSLSDLELLDSLMSELEASRGITEAIEVSALIESATGILNVQSISRASRVSRLQLGETDLRADLGVATLTDETSLQFARSMVVFASAAAGIDSPVAAVSTNFSDLDAFRRSTQEYKSYGFFGRACIHPSQIPIVNEVFTPSDEEIAAAQEIIDLLSASGGGVAVDSRGHMIDEAVAKIARRALSGRSSKKYNS